LHLVAYWHRDRESGAWRLTSMREEYQKPAAQTEASPAE
jgi:hypothetical protein